MSCAGFLVQVTNTSGAACPNVHLCLCLESREPGVETSSSSVPRLSQSVGAFGLCLLGSSDGEMLLEKWGKKSHFLEFNLLFLCVILIARTPPLPLSYPIPHWTQFLVCGLYLFGFAFFLVVFPAEISGSLVSWEVFWSMEGFVWLGLNIGRKCRYWGEGHGVVSWKLAFRCFGVFINTS